MSPKIRILDTNLNSLAQITYDTVDERIKRSVVTNLSFESGLDQRIVLSTCMADGLIYRHQIDTCNIEINNNYNWEEYSRKIDLKFSNDYTAYHAFHS